MKPVEVVKAMLSEARTHGAEGDERYAAARARAAREKPDRMRFLPPARRRPRADRKRARRDLVAELREQGFDDEYLDERYGRRRR